MNEQPHGRNTIRSRRSRLIATTILSAGVSMLTLFAGSPAQAKNECGAAVAGTVTCTAAGNPYANGVSYTPTADLTVRTNADTKITGNVSVDARPVPAANVTFNHAGAISASAKGRDAVDLSGHDVAVTISGSIANTGALIPATYDANNVQLTPAIAANGVVVTATGATSVTNNGAISVAGDQSTALVVNATGDVTLGGTGKITTTGGSDNAISVTSKQGSVSGTIANVSVADGNLGMIHARGTVTLDVDNVTAGSLSIVDGAFDAQGNALATRVGDVTLTTGTLTSEIDVSNYGGGVSLTANGHESGSFVLTGSGAIKATLNGETDGTVNLTSTADLASVAANANVGRDISVAGATSADVTVAKNVSISGNTVVSGGTSASVTLAQGVKVGGNVVVTGNTAATLGIAQGVTIGGYAALTTSGGAASILLPTGSSVGGDLTAIAQGSGTSANIEITSGATISGGLKAQGNTTASILIDRGGSVGKNNPNVNLGSINGASFTNLGSFGSETSVGTITASGGNTVVTNSGFLGASFQFTGGGNRVDNSGTIVLGYNPSGAIGDSGVNSFTNSGTIRIVSLEPGTQVGLAGVSQFSNSGVIDMRNGFGNDVLTISGVSAGSGGVFVGSGDSTVYLDVYNGKFGTLTDKLVATGAISGSTKVVLSTIGGAVAFTPSIVFAQGGAGTTASALTVIAPASTSLVRYSTSFDPATNSFALIGTPGDGLAREARINEGAQQLWYRSVDTLSAHFSEVRDARFGGYAKDGGRVWGTMYGQTSRRRGTVDASAFGVAQATAAGYSQDTFGGQLGFDPVGHEGGDGFTVGITGGYQQSKLNFQRSADSVRYRVANAGLLVGFQRGGLFANALGQFSYAWLRDRIPDLGYSDRSRGNSYGGQAELGYRLGSDRLFVEPVATIAYVRTNLDKTRIADFDIDFGVFQGLRGKAGARLGSHFDLGGGASAIVYAQGNYVHEFKGDGAIDVANNGVFASIRNRALPDYGEGKIGFSAGMAGGVTGFVEGFGTAGKSYRGGGGRAGLRLTM